MVETGVPNAGWVKRGLAMLLVEVGDGSIVNPGGTLLQGVSGMPGCKMGGGKSSALR